MPLHSLSLEKWVDVEFIVFTNVMEIKKFIKSSSLNFIAFFMYFYLPLKSHRNQVESWKHAEEQEFSKDEHDIIQDRKNL